MTAAMRDDEAPMIPGIRRLPHDVDVEAALIGAILVNNRAYERVADFLKPEHFALADHRLIYEAAGRAIERGGIANPVTLRNAVEQHGGVDAGYLLRAANRAVSVVDAVIYGRMIHDAAIRRMIIAAGEAMIERAYTADVVDVATAQIDAARVALEGLAAAAAGASFALPTMDHNDLCTLPPPRGWLMGIEICREFCTILTARGGTGKTAISMLWALSLATGKPLAGHKVFQRARVAMITAEDGDDEIKRRLHATATLYDEDLLSLGDWLTVHNIASTGSQLLAVISGEAVDAGLAGTIESFVRQRRVDVLFVDPWVKVAGAPENDNQIMDRAINKLVTIAQRRKIAVVILHHHKKGSSNGDAGDLSRGASSLIDAVRIGRAVDTISDEDADRAGITKDQRRNYVTVTDSKRNLTARQDCTHYELVGVKLMNATEQYPNGDTIGAAKRWFPPEFNMVDEIKDEMIVAAIDAGLPDGERYTDANRATGRSAVDVVMRVRPEIVSKKVAREILERLISVGALVRREYFSPSQRRNATGLYAVKLGES